MKRWFILFVLAAILVQGYCAYAQDLQSKEGGDVFRSPWECVNEYYAKSQREVREEYEKSRSAALKGERDLLWCLVPGMMYYRMFRKTFMDKDQAKP